MNSSALEYGDHNIVWIRYTLPTDFMSIATKHQRYLPKCHENCSIAQLRIPAARFCLWRSVYDPAAYTRDSAVTNRSRVRRADNIFEQQQLCNNSNRRSRSLKVTCLLLILTLCCNCRVYCTVSETLAHLVMNWEIRRDRESYESNVTLLSICHFRSLLWVRWKEILAAKNIPVIEMPINGHRRTCGSIDQWWWLVVESLSTVIASCQVATQGLTCHIPLATIFKHPTTKIPL